MKKLPVKLSYNIFSRLLSLLFFITIGVQTNAQTTTIPDSNFEQALIDLGIDSDGVVNGEVLTSDIENVTTLDVSGNQIGDLTGIEDFSSLETLDVSYNFIGSLDLTGNAVLKHLTIEQNYELSNLNLSNNLQLEYLFCQFSSLTELDLSSNGLLKELILGEGHEINSNHQLEFLDLSNNTALEKVWITEIPTLNYINLNNGNNEILTDVYIYCIIEEFDCSDHWCLIVDDAEAANTSQEPYSDWIADVGQFTNTLEECSLSLSNNEVSTLSIYPNPAKTTVTIEGVNATLVEVFSLSGKKVLETYNTNTLNVSNLPTEMYLLKIHGNNSIITQKLLVF